MITSPKNNEKIYAKTLAAFQNNIPTVSLPLGANRAASKQVSTLVQKRQPDLYPIALQNTTFALEMALLHESNGHSYPVKFTPLSGCFSGF